MNIKPESKQFEEFDEEGFNIYIKRTENFINENRVKLHSLSEPLQEAREMYESILKEYDLKKKELEMDEALLKKLVNLKKKREPNAEVDVKAKKSYSVKKSREPRGKIIPWQEYILEILKEANRFMTIGDLYSTIVDRYNIFKEDKRKISQYRWSFKNAIILPHAEKVRKKGKGLFTSFGKEEQLRIGLVEWFNPDWVPQPKYIKEFMYKAG